MEAKDTIISDEKIFNAVDKWKLLGFSTDSIAKSVALEQAEISFKAGMQEVVEWLERYKKIKVPKYQLQEWGIDVK